MLKKSVYIVGPSSTGKTTLCMAVAKRLGVDEGRTVSEIARNVMRTRGFTRMDIGRLEMQQAILDAILENHEGNSVQPPRIHDRSAIDPVVYAILTATGDEEARRRKEQLFMTEKFQSALEQYRQSVFILLKPVREWITDDGIRFIEDLDKCYEMFGTVLKECGIQFREIGTEVGFLEERVAWLMGLCS
ncbi:hypothetical protein P691DRAFT_733951 [Macrolepiota fuliginosa MF-IS2]|uniref:NadR/Ttd14 AAA domain-containing protein n=1 Tax=Macrolepiota fuliginosa MF-IS2 TaxID=1400762 RepID=A0A9P6C011_9AGAR|nr:hypothetical protein P691DRAFT_733951 [Macrolepiota fuliginosa MF-IS2]